MDETKIVDAEVIEETPKEEVAEPELPIEPKAIVEPEVVTPAE